MRHALSRKREDDGGPHSRQTRQYAAKRQESESHATQNKYNVGQNAKYLIVFPLNVLASPGEGSVVPSTSGFTRRRCALKPYHIAWLSQNTVVKTWTFLSVDVLTTVPRKCGGVGEIFYHLRKKKVPDTLRSYLSLQREGRLLI